MIKKGNDPRNHSRRLICIHYRNRLKVMPTQASLWTNWANKISDNYRPDSPGNVSRWDEHNCVIDRETRFGINSGIYGV